MLYDLRRSMTMLTTNNCQRRSSHSPYILELYIWKDFTYHTSTFEQTCWLFFLRCKSTDEFLQISFDVPLNIVTYYDDDLQTGCRLPYLLLIRRGLADYRPSWVWLALTLHDTLHSSLVEDTPTQRTHTNSHSLLASNSSVLLCLWDIWVLQGYTQFGES